MKMDNEWVLAGCKAGEAILLTVGKTAGIKKLPAPGDVSEWCVYTLGEKLFGPLRATELINKLNTRQVPFDIRIWSPLATSWLKPSQTENKIVFFDETGTQIPTI